MTITTTQEEAVTSTLPPPLPSPTHGGNDIAEVHRLYRLGRLEEAREQGLLLHRSAPGDLELLRLLALIHHALGEAGRGLAFLSEVSRLAPTSAADHYTLGLMLLELGHVPEAIQAFTLALAVQPDFAEANLAHGNALMLGGRPADAVAPYLKASRVPRCAHHAFCNLARAYSQLDLLPAATQALTQAAAIEPENIETLTQLGKLLAEQGRLADAITTYQKVLHQTPDRPDIHEKTGDLHLRAGNYTAAIPCYRMVLGCQPGNLKVMNNLGLVLHLLDRTDEALAIYRQALAISDEVAETHFNLGNALMAKGRREEALDAYQTAVRRKPDYGEAWFNLGIVSQKLQRYAEAEGAYCKSLALRGPLADTFFNLALVRQAQGRLREAIDDYGEAIRLAPDHAMAHYNLGIALNEAGRHHEATSCFRAALALEPQNVKVLNNLGLALLEQELLVEAEAHLRQAISIAPTFADAHSNLGNLYLQQGREEEARDSYANAIDHDPHFAKAYYNLGCCFLQRNEPGEAVANYRKAIALQPDFVEAHWNLSNALLLQGELAEGFHEYRWRWRRKGADIVVLPLPEWRGETLPEATILVITEQGKGDTLQFVRSLSLVKKRVGKIIVACDASLHGLLAGMPEIDRTIAKNEVAAVCKECACHIPLLNLPEVLGTTLDTIPADIPYLQPDTVRVEAFRELFSSHGHRLKIGLVWRGNPGHRNDHNRSCRPEEFLSLASLEGISLFSLQLTEQPPATLPGIVDLAPHIRSFADTAALMSHLDLILTVDTATAHLAGALGRPVWTLLPFVPDWRWLLDREDTPWYPTMRLFRQSANKNWPEVIRKVREHLVLLQNSRQPRG